MDTRPKILFVEDNIKLREVGVIKLKQSGYDVIELSDGKNTLKVMEKEKPDLLLLDILLPHKDGYEVLEDIKSSKSAVIKSIPVVILSNLNNENDIFEAKELGAYDYLVKANVTLEGIVEKVRQVLEEKKMGKRG